MLDISCLFDLVNNAAERPFFLVGAERSGSTLLRLMLNHHPQISFHFESGFIVQPLLHNQKEPEGAQLRTYTDSLRASSSFKASGFAIDESLSYRQLLRSFFRQKVVFTGKPIVGATVHAGFEYLPKLWPEAKYIHLLRDGRDVANSAMRMGWYGNVWAATERWKQAIASYDKLVKQIPDEAVLEVRFERLVSDPMLELQRISDFIGVPYNHAFWDYAQTSSYELPGRNKATNWRSNLDERTVQLVEAEIRELLQRFGYKLSGLDQIQVTTELHRELVRENVKLRRKRRIERYGLGTVILNKFAGQFSIIPIKVWSQSRIAKINRKHIK